MRRFRRAAGGLTCAVALAGCGYEGSNDVRRIPSDALFGLDQTTTTSTSTTTTTSTTLPPQPPASVEVTAVSVVTTAELTTTTVLATENVRLFFLDDEQVTSVTQNISSPVRLRRVLEALEAGPLPGQATVGLSTAVPDGLRRLVAELSPRTSELDVEFPTINGYAFYDYSRQAWNQMWSFTPSGVAHLSRKGFVHDRWADRELPRFRGAVARWAS